MAKNDMLVSINNHEIDDGLDFAFYNDISIRRRIKASTNGQTRTFFLKEQDPFDIELAQPRWRRCENNCDFCFINGLPPGVRGSLLFRDDDFRLSFMHGNFVSLTNLTKDDYRKIFRLRLSPLYVSVHSTNPHLRAAIFKNDAGADIMKQLSVLISNNIIVHTQIVILPGINDGEQLLKTIDDLVSLFPGVASIGIVPVGRTRYNKTIKPVSKRSARAIAGLARNLNRQFRKKHEKGIVYASDEIFINAGQTVPDIGYYDDMPQHENGIGMARDFLDAMRSWRGGRPINKKVLILTGQLACPLLLKMKARMIALGLIDRTNIIIRPVANNFFGNSVTVAGLLAGNDMNNTIKKYNHHFDLILLPPHCKNSENKLIDDQQIPPGAKVAPAKYKGFVKWLRSL